MSVTDEGRVVGRRRKGAGASVAARAAKASISERTASVAAAFLRDELSTLPLSA